MNDEWVVIRVVSVRCIASNYFDSLRRDGQAELA